MKKQPARNTLVVVRITKLWLPLTGLLLLCVQSVLAQPAYRTIGGKVLDQQTGKPIAYANIGILGKNVGTLSNPDGSFSVQFPSAHAADSLTFAALGYATRSFALQSLLQQSPVTVFLTPRVYRLAEVVVRSQRGKPQEARLGISRGNGGSYSGNAQTAGAAMAVRLTAKSIPFRVTQARLRLFYNPFPDCKVRLRLLAVDQATGKPGKDLLEKSVLITATLKKGWIEADLAPYALTLDQESFYLAFEWIEDDTRRKTVVEFWDAYAKANPDKMQEVVRVVDGQEVLGIVSKELVKNTTYFATSSHPKVLKAYPCYSRDSSLDEWKRSSAVPVATVTLVYP